jgi:hypothetical protein
LARVSLQRMQRMQRAGKHCGAAFPGHCVTAPPTAPVQELQAAVHSTKGCVAPSVECARIFREGTGHGRRYTLRIVPRFPASVNIAYIPGMDRAWKGHGQGVDRAWAGHGPACLEHAHAACGMRHAACTRCAKAKASGVLWVACRIWVTEYFSAGRCLSGRSGNRSVVAGQEQEASRRACFQCAGAGGEGC